MVFRYRILMFALLAALLFGCSKEDDEYVIEETEIEIEGPIEVVNDLIAGRITNFDDEPLEEATVSLYNKQELLINTITDETGYYEFNTEGLEHGQRLLTIEKEGFLTVRKVVDVGPGQVVSSKLSVVLCTFSFEEFDHPYLEIDGPMVTISGKAFNVNGEGAGNSYVSMVNADFLDPGGTRDFSNAVAIQADGSWEAIVPQNMEIRLFVDNRRDCNEDFMRDIGPFTEDAIIPDLEDLAVSYRQLVTFEYPQCTNEDLAKGVMLHFFDGNFFTEWYLFEEGIIYDFNSPRDLEKTEINVCQIICNESYRNILLAYDFSTNNYFLKKETFGEIIDFGVPEVCTPLESHYDIQLDGEQVMIQNPNYFERKVTFDTGEPYFTITRLGDPFEGAIDLRLRVRDELAENTTYTSEVDVKLSYFKEAKAFGNFEGSVTITKIEDGYVYGEFDGLIYPSFSEWPHVEITKDGPAQNITGTFKSLFVD